MKKEIHPEYKEVVFLDTSSEFKFLTKSTMSSSETIKWEDGNEYPLVKIEVSSASHPFYTGKKLFVDTAGRVEKFNKRYKSNLVKIKYKVFKISLEDFIFLGYVKNSVLGQPN